MNETVWPRLDDPSLAPTLQTLHLWTQVVGKVRLMHTPWENHGWHVPFYLAPRGLVTGLAPVAGRAFTFEFDLLGGELVLRTSAGAEIRRPLSSPNMAQFYAGVLAMLEEQGLSVALNTMPAGASARAARRVAPQGAPAWPRPAACPSRDRPCSRPGG